MQRCSLRAWIPLWPLPVWPRAGPCLLGQNTVAGSMIDSFWLCMEAGQEEYVGVPLFITSALHHGSGQCYQTSGHGRHVTVEHAKASITFLGLFLIGNTEATLCIPST